jgi:phosphomethylpyrimidine synthase
MIKDRNVEEINSKIMLEIVEKQAKQGVDFFTIHPDLLKQHLPLIENRVAGIVSRGGALLAKWMLYHNKQNPLYEMFDDLCEILVEYDICFSLGDGLRPGAIADATDDAQIAELKTLGKLTSRAQEKGCQVMVEGPGHVPFDQIQYNMEIQQQICHGAPFYVLGPLVTDIAPGYDQGLPDADDVRAGVIAAKIAAHAGDVARGLKGIAGRDKRLSIARTSLNWKTHLAESLDPQTAERMHNQACKEIGIEELPSADYCSMCGKAWCSVRINKEIRDGIKNGQTAKL